MAKKAILKMAAATILNFKIFNFSALDCHQVGEGMVACQILVFTYITESSTKSAKLMRWLLSLQSYNVTFKYKEGRKNVVADCLLRLDSATE